LQLVSDFFERAIVTTVAPQRFLGGGKEYITESMSEESQSEHGPSLLPTIQKLPSCRFWFIVSE
jgi:hypothetical protein